MKRKRGSTYSGRWFARETVYHTGDRIEGDLYPVFQRPGQRRKKSRPTSAIQARLNERNAARKLTRLIHENFSESDLTLHLTYRPGELPEDEEAAKKDVRNFLRRMKRKYRAAGIEMKYIYVTERGTKSGRVHHHLILTGGVDRDELEKLWGKGYANSKRLQLEDEGAAPLAKYVTKDRWTYRRWTGSRNLVQPEPVQLDGAITQDELEEAAEAVEEGRGEAWLEKRYPGYRCVMIEAERNLVNRGTYIRYEMRRITPYPVKQGEKGRRKNACGSGQDEREGTGAGLRERGGCR